MFISDGVSDSMVRKGSPVSMVVAIDSFCRFLSRRTSKVKLKVSLDANAACHIPVYEYAGEWG